MSSLAIEDYALIGDTESAALVGNDGSIDWLCLPRFDPEACFASLLGTRDHGRWLLAPVDEILRTERRYRPDSLVLETELHTKTGVVRLVDCMPMRDDHPDVVRIVEGVSGRVPMRMELVIRFGYGQIVPWVRSIDGRLRAVAGPDALALATPIETRGEDRVTVAEFVVAAGERVPFTLTWFPSHEPMPATPDPFAAVEGTERYWRAWAAKAEISGPRPAKARTSMGSRAGRERLGVLVLARRRLCARRSPGRCPGAGRSTRRTRQRCRAPRRGVRPGWEAPRRQLPGSSFLSGETCPRRRSCLVGER